MKITLGLIQMGMLSGMNANLDKAKAKIKEAAAKGANIVCLPELFTSPYFPQDEKDRCTEYAQTVPGKSTEMLSKAARDNSVVVVGGSIYERDGKKLYNTTVVFDETGKALGKYRKMHIPHDPKFYEQNYFLPGNLGYKVFKTRYGTIAPLICYDQWFPEAARTVALMDADIVFYPTAIGRIKGIEQAEGNWQEAWENVQRGHAIANSMIVAAVNRVGNEKDMNFWGGSFVCDAFGKTLVRGGSLDEILIAQCDLDHGKMVREGWRFFNNRRPDTYGKITEK